MNRLRLERGLDIVWICPSNIRTSGGFSGGCASPSSPLKQLYLSTMVVVDLRGIQTGPLRPQLR